MENLALTMRETADLFNEEKEKVKKVRHEKYVEDIIIPSIKAIAHSGGYSAHITIDTKYDWVMVKGLLTKLGFTVGNLSKYLTVYVAW